MSVFWIDVLEKKKGKLRKIMPRIFLSVDLVIDKIVSIRRPAATLKIKWLTWQNAVSSRFVATKLFLVPKRPIFSLWLFPIHEPKILAIPNDPSSSICPQHETHDQHVHQLWIRRDSHSQYIRASNFDQLYSNYIGNCKTYTSKDLFL